MVHADGARFDINGVLTPPLGRKKLRLNFPNEGVGDEDDYKETIPHLQLNGRTRGYGAFYDKRIAERAQEILDDRHFDLGTPAWAAVNDFDEGSGSGFANYNHSAGNGTLTQALADMAGVPVGGQKYLFKYAVRGGLPTNFAVNITTSFADQTVVLDATLGVHEVVFTSAAVPSDFVLSATSTGGANQWLLNYVSLTPILENAPPIPQRLNIVGKVNGTVFLNKSVVGGADGILDGDGSFVDPNTRAKVVTRSDGVFMADSSTRPKILRQRPNSEQSLYNRVLYDVRGMGIHWPRESDDAPTSVANVDLPNGVAQGIYKFRVSLENKMGDKSNLSLATIQSVAHSSTAGFTVTLTMPDLPDDLVSGSGAVTKFRIYVSFLPTTIKAGGVHVPAAAEPSPYKYWKSIDISTVGATVTTTFQDTDSEKFADYPDLQRVYGAPPRLRDFIILNDVGYGIAESDTIQNEGSVSESEALAIREQQRGFQHVKFREATEIKDVNVDPTYLIISAPGEPQYMENWVRFARGDEVGIGLATMGNNVVIVTNKGIVMYDPADREVRRIPADDGTLSRDSIKDTDRGVRYVGSDGIPRLFNGAIVEEVADELLPVFDKEDYKGNYKRFDPTYASEVSSANGNRRYFLNYPVSDNPGTSVPAAPTMDPVPQRNMAIADGSRPGRPRWAIDTTGYEQILWLGRESRLVGVDFNGAFYFLEEGFSLENQSTGSSAPIADWRFAWYGRGPKSRFRKWRCEIDTKGQNVGLLFEVDGDLQHSITLNTSGREERKGYLPGNFKGLYCEARIIGTTHATAGRFDLYDVDVEVIQKGVF